ncbi:GMC family oxidoreductase [Planctomycetota bacterium]
MTDKGQVYQYWDVTKDEEVEADAVVVGSGAGGATVAAELAEGGLSVVVLEEGGAYDTKSFNGDAIQGIKRLYRDAGVGVICGRPQILLAEGRCLGGSTVINGGMSWRTPERVLKRWEMEFAIPGLATGAMDPIFDRIEERIHVNIQAPDSLGGDDALLRLGAERLGFRLTPNRRNQSNCVGANNCAFGCPTGAKQSTLVSYLPRAAAFGAAIYTDCRVEQVLLEPGASGRPRAVGVAGRLCDPKTQRPGPRLTVRARHTILACGATQTPALLLRNGIANSSGEVGRNFTVHPNAKCVGIFDEPVYGWRGVHQGHQVHEFLREGILIAIAFLPPQILALSLPFLGDELFDVMQALNRMVVAGALVEDTTAGTVRPGPFGMVRMRYDLTRENLAQLTQAVALTAELLFAAGARKVVVPVHGVAPLQSPDDVQTLYRAPIPPEDLEVVTVHPMGTCRMGADPTRCVVDPFGEAHDVRSLYVADASVLPTPIGVNPMLSIMGLATRTALRVLGLV